MPKLRHMLVIIIIVIPLFGCGDQHVLDKLGLVNTLSYDLVEGNEGKSDEKYKISTSIPLAFSEGQGVQREFLTVTAATSKEGKIKVSRMTELLLVSGQLRSTLFGMSLAKNGIWEVIDTLVRDTTISPQVKVVVVDGNAHELLKKDFPPHPRTGRYIDRMLAKEANVKSIPSATIFQFTKDYLDDGIDPVAPIIKDAGGNVILNGIALFQDERYMMKIEPDQALVFAMMRGNFKKGEISFNLEEVSGKNENVMFTSIISKRKIKASSSFAQNQFNVDIRVKMKAALLEYTGDLNLTKEKDRNELEKLVSEYITSKAQAMVGEMQKNNVDSLGIGRFVRNTLSYKQWKSLDWREQYPSVKINCQVKVTINDQGNLLE